METARIDHCPSAMQDRLRRFAADAIAADNSTISEKRKEFMTSPISQPIQKLILRTLSLSLLSSLIIATPLLVAQKSAHDAATHGAPAPPELVKKVREGT